MKIGLGERFRQKVARTKLVVSRYFFRVKTYFTGDKQPSSTPFISGDGFRALADHVFDSVDAQTIIPGIYKGDIIFVASPFMKTFFETIHPRIQEPYILITHNGDDPVDAGMIEHIDDKIIHWFGQNVTIAHPKVTPIPIGLENIILYQNGVPSMYSRLQKKISRGRVSKQPRIFYHFKVATNPQRRQPVLDYLKSLRSAETIPHKLPQELYLGKLASYMFVASPPGNGEDCIRTWEAIYLGVVPIVKRSVSTDYFKNLGLPMMLVEDWHELDSYDLERLQQSYTNIMKTCAKQALSMEYWAHIIETAQSDILSRTHGK